MIAATSTLLMTIIMLTRIPKLNADVNNNGIGVARARSAKKKNRGKHRVREE